MYFHQSFSDYKIGNSVQRFHLRDDVLSGSLIEKCVSSWHAQHHEEKGIKLQTHI